MALAITLDDSSLDGIVGDAYDFAKDHLRYTVDPTKSVYEHVGETIMSTEMAQKYVCPRVKTMYFEFAKQKASEAPNAKAQAAAMAAEWLQNQCPGTPPTQSEAYPSAPPAEAFQAYARTNDPTKLYRQIRYVETPFYKKGGFWLGLGLIGAAGAGAYWLSR